MDRDLLLNLLRQLVTGVDIDTKDGPPVRLRDPFAPQKPGPGFIESQRPQVTVRLSQGLEPVVLAPYGRPGPTNWPKYVQYAQLGGVVVGGLALFGLLSLFSGKK